MRNKRSLDLCGPRNAGNRPLDKFVKRENIRHFQRMLDEAKDEGERQRLRKLLADEEVRGSLDAPHRTDPKSA